MENMKQPTETIERFEPNIPAVRRERCLIGAVVAILGPGLLYLSGEQNLVVLIGLGCLGGVAGYGIYALRNRLRAVQWIEITTSGVTFAHRGNEIRLAWDMIVKVTPHYHYGDFLTIHTRGNKRAYTFLLEGFTTEQLSSIKALIQERPQ
jgi:hypothetical protein